MDLFRRPIRILIAVAVTVLLVAAACGAGDNDSSGGEPVSRALESEDGASSGDGGDGSAGDGDSFEAEVAQDASAGEDGITLSEGDERAPTPADESADTAEAAQTEGGGDDEATDSGPGVVPVGLDVTDLGRDIIKTGTMTIETDDVLTASQRASAAIAQLGGVVFGQETTTEGRPRTVFTFKVRPADFDKARVALANVGDVVDQTVSVDDVTERVVDLQSRITTSEASVLRLRALLEQASDLDSIAHLENQLLDRETNLEALRGQLRTLEDQVALATLVVTVIEAVEPVPMPAVAVATTAFAGHDAGVCPGEDRLDLDGDTDITVCVEVANTGDSRLAGVSVETTGIDIPSEDFEVASGTPNRLEPGESVVFTAQVTVDDSTQLVASAVAHLHGEPDGEAVGARGAMDISIDRPTTLPGFGDSLERGWGAVQSIFSVVLVAIGVLLPFSWLIALAALAIWWSRRRQGHEAATG